MDNTFPRWKFSPLINNKAYSSNKTQLNMSNNESFNLEDYYYDDKDLRNTTLSTYPIFSSFLTDSSINNGSNDYSIH